MINRQTSIPAMEIAGNVAAAIDPLGDIRHSQN